MALKLLVRENVPIIAVISKGVTGLHVINPFRVPIPQDVSFFPHGYLGISGILTSSVYVVAMFMFPSTTPMC